MTTGQQIHHGRRGLVIARDGRVQAEISAGQLRLLHALGMPGELLPIRQATRAIWPDQAGPLTSAQMASAARSITRLVRHGLAVRRDDGVAITPTGALVRISEQVAGPRDRSASP
jgi:hypothetical protein